MSEALKQLERGEWLNTDEALAWLAGYGIHTNRNSLTRKRKSGALACLHVSGRYSILYRPADLAKAYVKGPELCHSRNSNAARKGSGICAEQLPDAAYTKALALVTGAPQKRSGSGRKAKSSRAHR